MTERNDNDNVIEFPGGRQAKQVPVGADITEALEAANTPMATLAAAYNHAPHPAIRDFINQRVTEVLVAEMPKIEMLMMQGPALSVDKMRSCEDVFTSAMEEIDGHPDAPSATVRDIGRELAEVLDKGVRRVLLTDTHANRLAALDIISSHAQLLAALNDLALTEEQVDSIREWEDGNDESNDS